MSEMLQATVVRRSLGHLQLRQSEPIFGPRLYHRVCKPQMVLELLTFALQTPARR